MAGISPGDDPSVVSTELDWIGTMAVATGLTATFIVLQHTQDPERWRLEMEAANQWRARGGNVVPLVAGRPFGVLLGWEVRHPFRLRPSYEAVDHLPRAERVERLREPELRDRILSEQPVTEDPVQTFTQAALIGLLPFCYVLAGDDPDYEQPAAQSLMAIAERGGYERGGGGVRRACPRRRFDDAAAPVVQLRRRQPRRAVRADAGPDRDPRTRRRRSTAARSATRRCPPTC